MLFRKALQHFSAVTIANRYALLAFCVHALVIGASLVPGLRHLPLLTGDAVTYYLPAQNLVEHGAFSREVAAPFLWEPYRTPGYPLLIALTQMVAGGQYAWVLFLAAFTAAAAAWSAVKVTQYFGGKDHSLHAAGWLVALLPNSLGLSAQLLTDALAGHLFLIWLYITIIGLSKRSTRFLWCSFFLLLVLQSLKPTFNTALVLIVVLIPLYAKRPFRWSLLLWLSIGSLLMPSFLAFQNYRDHGVHSASLLGVETVREYLMVRALAEDTGTDYETMTKSVRTSDKSVADQLKMPSSFYGRLYKVKKARVQEFMLEHPIRVAGLALSEMLRQALAPQEFVFQVFWGDLPVWGRILGSLLTVLLWLSAAWGGYTLWMQGNWQACILGLVVLLYFLGTASVSHLVGARLRFPADMALIPLMASGIGSFLQSKGLRKSDG